MGKEGPCYHCGITTTPLWRNGPPDKPVLCNACGSRWRTKGSLHNYMPMHSGGFGIGERWPARAPTFKPSRKRKEPSDVNSDTGFSRTGNYYLATSVDEDTSTRSSLGSEVSTLDGPSNHVRGAPWDKRVPSRKRTNMFRSRASSERISKNLVSVEDQEVSSVTYPSTETAVVEAGSPLVAVEVGLGGVVIRPPPQHVEESESETSSLLVGNRNFDHGELVGQVESKRRASDRRTRRKKSIDVFPYNKRTVLQSSKSPLCDVELKDVVNFDMFSELLTRQEQADLIKYVPSTDNSDYPESVKSMFSSPQFEAALSNFQLLLSHGMFDPSDPELNAFVSHHFQQLLAVTDLTESGWMKGFSQLQSRRRPKSKKDVAETKQPQVEHKTITAAHHRLPLVSGMADSEPQEVPVHVSMPERPHAPRELSNLTFHLPRGNVPKAASPPAGLSSIKMAADRSQAEPPQLRKAEQQEEQHQQQKQLPQKRRYSVIEEGHDSGGEEDLLVDMPVSMSFHQVELLPQRSSWNYELQMNNNNMFNTGGWSRAAAPAPAEDDRTAAIDDNDLMINNPWRTDWDGDLIWNSSNSNSLGGLLLPSGAVP